MAEWRVGDSFPVDEPGPLRLLSPIKDQSPRSAARRFFTGWVLPLLAAYFIFAVLFFVALPITLFHAVRQRERSWRRAVLVLILSPFFVIPAWGFGCGVADYLRGRASIRSSVSRHGHLDPRTRCYRRGPRCLSDFSEDVKDAGSDLAVVAMVSAFGPMSGHHQGWYPSREEAFAAIKDGRSFTISREHVDYSDGGEALAALLAEELGFGPSQIFLEPCLEGGYEGWFAEPVLDSRISYTDTERRLSLAERNGTVFFGNEDLVWLFSRQTGELYACYR